MKPAFAIEAEGIQLGIAVRDGIVFRFHAARTGLFGLEKFRFVALNDVQRAARRSYASETTKAARHPASELSRHKALSRWRGLQAG